MSVGELWTRAGHVAVDSGAALSIWRHPRPRGAIAGRCIGRTDLAVDPRKAKRLAHRIRAHARREGLPRIVLTSPLRRSRDVGRWLASWGWAHRIDERLIELDFGAWDGQAWQEIGARTMDAWIHDFTGHAPGGGETVASLLERCAAFIADEERAGVCAVGHAGWLSAARWLMAGRSEPPTAAAWPAAVGYGKRVDCAGDFTAPPVRPGGS